MESPAPQKRRKRKVLFTGFGVFLLFVLAFVIVFYANFTTVQVAGDSMEPTLNSGQRVLTTRAYWLVGDIRRNDVVVMKMPGTGTPIIKRVYAMPGEVVDFYNVPDEWDLSRGEYRVPERTIYVLGDNRPASDDSRSFGPVAFNDVIGKVIRAEFGPSSAVAQP